MVLCPQPTVQVTPTHTTYPTKCRHREMPWPNYCYFCLALAACCRRELRERRYSIVYRSFITHIVY